MPRNNVAGAVDQWLKNKGKRFTKKLGVSLFALVVVIDVAVAVFLRQAPELLSPSDSEAEDAMWLEANRTAEDYRVSWTWQDLIRGLSDFSSDTVDILLISVLRIVLLAALLVLGVYVGTPRLNDISDRGTVAPLLINSGEGQLHERSSAAKSSHLESFDRQKNAEVRKNAVIGVMFSISTAAQIYTGIKVINFVGHWDDGDAAAKHIQTVQAVLFFSTVVVTNFEAFIANRLVGTLTVEEGFYVPEFHQHRLFFDKRHGHTCDLCGNSGEHWYRCNVCDFDACPACFNKKDKSTGEGVMRGDKGVRDNKVVGRFEYLSRGIRLIWPHLGLFLLALACLLAQTGASLYLPSLQGQLFDHIIKANHECTHSGSDSPACSSSENDFQSVILTYVIISVVLGFLQALRNLLFQLCARLITMGRNGVRNRLFRKMIVQDIAFFDGMRTGDIQQRIQYDVSTMVTPIYTTLSTVLSNVTTLIGGVVMCFITSWRLSMLAFTTILPMMHITGVYADWSRKINSQIYQFLSDVMSRMGEAVTNIRTVRACSSEDYEAKRNEEGLRKALIAGIKDAFANGLAAALNDYLDLLAGVLILWYGGSIAMEPHGAITTGQLITYQLYFNMINTSIQALNDMVNSFTRAAGAAERVLSLYDLTPDIDPDGGASVDLVVRRWDISFEDVHFHYQMRPQQKVLQGMSFQVSEGQVAALVGRSGGGKSTMVHMLLRFYDPRSGRITLGGVDLRELHVKSMHQHIGVVSQETQLFNTTIGDNLTYGCDVEPTREEVIAACKAAQAFHFIQEFEDGLSTRVGERGQRLSGGQKQRLAIARCLLRKPRLLLLDEATSALDAESEAQVQKALDQLIWGGRHTVVLVAHRLSTVINAHTIIVVEKGRAAEQGSHQELLALNGTYAGLVAHQVQKQRETLQEGAAQAREGGQGGGAKRSSSLGDGIDALFESSAQSQPTIGDRGVASTSSSSDRV